MCGIAGVSGKNAVIKSLMITMYQANRGRYGCGFACVRGNRILVHKEPIDPVKFSKKIGEYVRNLSDIAITHNRLPSRGGISIENTHPFLSCGGEFAFIHNGTWACDDSKELLIYEGHRILGDTDSEVLCHILEEFYEDYGYMSKALLKFSEHVVTGAVLVLTNDRAIYGVRTEIYPLNIARSGNEIYLASERRAIRSMCKLMHRYVDHEFSLKPYQVVEVRKGRVKLYGEGKKPRFKPRRITNFINPYYDPRFPSFH